MATRQMSVSQTKVAQQGIPPFEDVWTLIDGVKGFLVPGQERWLFNAVANLSDDAVIVEIGPFLGRSTTAMAFACLGTNRKIFAIDTFKGNLTDFLKGKNNVDWQGEDYLSTFEDNLAQNGLLEFVTPVRGLSGDIGRDWNIPIDFLFVDGSHEYEDVISDFELFMPWVKPGAMIAFHDVEPQWKGPFKAWQEVIQHRLDRPSHFFTIAFGRKPYDGGCFAGTVHVIIPVHNRMRFTKTCLKTLRTQVIKDHIKVHVVDDGSTDGTPAMLQDEFPEVHVIKGDGTLWWTGAVANALDMLKADFKPWDFFLLINNDVSLGPETVETLVRESLRLNRAAVAPVALNANNAISTGWGNGTALVLNDFECQFTRMLQCENTLQVGALFGRCSLYPVEILDLVGNFDAEVFPHYHGDTDFGLRAGRFRFPIYVTGCTCIRVCEDKSSTGSHYSFRQGPQNLAKVKENMFSIKSIDNVFMTWRYMSRHYPNRRYVGTISAFWRSLRQWQPVYWVWEIVAPTYRRVKINYGRSKNYVKALMYLSVRPTLFCKKLISIVGGKGINRSDE